LRAILQEKEISLNELDFQRDTVFAVIVAIKREIQARKPKEKKQATSLEMEYTALLEMEYTAFKVDMFNECIKMGYKGSYDEFSDMCSQITNAKKQETKLKQETKPLCKCCLTEPTAFDEKCARCGYWQLNAPDLPSPPVDPDKPCKCGLYHLRD